MRLNSEDKKAVERIKAAAGEQSIDLKEGRIRRTSSRLCLAVEHGDYNGTDLLGVGTDRFIWFGYKPSRNGKFRLFSLNFPEDGVVEFQQGNVPEPESSAISGTWGRFPYGVAYILRKKGFPLKKGLELAEIKEKALYAEIYSKFHQKYPSLCKRLKYIFQAQQRFSLMIKAWESGDVYTIGRLFKDDGLGLRDDHQISGPELETRCDIARIVPGVFGERMLGGGDKGAAGAIVLASHIDELRRAIDVAYPRSHPDYIAKYAVHVCRVVQGVTEFEGLL